MADEALLKWLSKVSPGSWNKTRKMPMLALSNSGGGLRALLVGAGVVKALDERDSESKMAGLYQACTYHAGLSGGAWLLSSFAGNNWPTISSLRDNLWSVAFDQGLLFSGFSWRNPTLFYIVRDIIAKAFAGFIPVLNDVWSRLLSDMLLYGKDGGVSLTLSGISTYSNFSSYSVPYPIILAQGVDTPEGQCFPTPNATQYEFAPFEFGSWDAGVAAFTPTKYLGSSLSNGQPSHPSGCRTGFDNLGYTLGASSNLFNEQFCRLAAPSSPLATNSTSTPALLQGLVKILKAAAKDFNLQRAYATVPNPFHNSPASPLVASSPLLTLVDGGESGTALSGQNDPLWPLIHPERGVDVIFVSDNSADTPDHFPDGEALRVTAAQAVGRGLGARMPAIPGREAFTAPGGISSRPTLFGCRSPEAVTIVYLPNRNYNFASGESTFKLQYKPAETRGMVANGELVASYNGAEDWPCCLACGIMAKSGGPGPAECKGCLEKYCYN